MVRDADSDCIRICLYHCFIFVCVGVGNEHFHDSGHALFLALGFPFETTVSVSRLIGTQHMHMLMQIYTTINNLLTLATVIPVAIFIVLSSLILLYHSIYYCSVVLLSLFLLYYYHFLILLLYYYCFYNNTIIIVFQ